MDKNQVNALNMHESLTFQKELSLKTNTNDQSINANKYNTENDANEEFISTAAVEKIKVEEFWDTDSDTSTADAVKWDDNHVVTIKIEKEALTEMENDPEELISENDLNIKTEIDFDEGIYGTNADKTHAEVGKTHKKPHLCDVCNKPFIRRWDLKRHRSIHSEEKPHFCLFCKNEKELQQKASEKENLLSMMAEAKARANTPSVSDDVSDEIERLAVLDYYNKRSIYRRRIASSKRIKLAPSTTTNKQTTPIAGKISQSNVDSLFPPENDNDIDAPLHLEYQESLKNPINSSANFNTSSSSTSRFKQTPKVVDNVPIKKKLAVKTKRNCMHKAQGIKTPPSMSDSNGFHMNTESFDQTPTEPDSTSEDSDEESHPVTTGLVATFAHEKITARDVWMQKQIYKSIKRAYQQQQKNAKIVTACPDHPHKIPRNHLQDDGDKMVEIAPGCGFYITKTLKALVDKKYEQTNTWDVIVKEIMVEVYGDDMINFSATGKRFNSRPRINPKLFCGLLAWINNDKTDGNVIPKSALIKEINHIISNRRCYLRKMTEKTIVLPNNFI